VIAALRATHETPLPDGSYGAHGDCREVNVLVRQQSVSASTAWKVCFVDFDGAGAVGQRLYRPSCPLPCNGPWARFRAHLSRRHTIQTFCAHMRVTDCSVNEHVKRFARFQNANAQRRPGDAHAKRRSSLQPATDLATTGDSGTSTPSSCAVNLHALRSCTVCSSALATSAALRRELCDPPRAVHRKACVHRRAC
jgi:hypothetical protein